MVTGGGPHTVVIVSLPSGTWQSVATGKKRADGFWEQSLETDAQGMGGGIIAHRPVGTALVRDGQNQGAQGRQTLPDNENGFFLRPWGQRKMWHGSHSSGPGCLCVVVTARGKAMWFP